MSTPGVYLWRGQTFLGAAAVAAASGTSRRTVQYHLTKHGDLSSLGNGPGGHNKGCAGGPGRPVDIFGRHWPSINSFAVSLGVTHKTATIWLRRGMHDRIMAKLMAADARAARMAS